MQRCRPTLGESEHNIALRQEADNAVIGAEDDDRADASLGQELTAAARSAVGSIVTTFPPLPSKMFLTNMAASLVPPEDGKAALSSSHNDLPRGSCRQG